MKKLLLLAAGAMLASSAAMAEETTPKHEVLPDYVLSTISSNGEWTVSVNPYFYTMIILNNTTGEEWIYEDESGYESYAGGMNHWVSDNGIVVATLNDSFGVYWENGEWNYLPVADTDYASYPNAITPDGSLIVGSVSRSGISMDETSSVMSVPAVWYRNAAGGYDMYTALPYPDRDWTGRVPQYVLIDDVSADGKLCGGCVTDYSGMVQQPIIFTLDDKGEWSYSLVHPELINPDGVVFPEYPGEAPDRPNAEDYMTDEQREAYNTAVQDYQNRPYPDYADYMTAEEYAAYEDAYNNYLNGIGDYPYANDYMTTEEFNAYNAAVTAYYNVPYPNPADFLSSEAVAEYNQAVLDYNAAAAVWNDAFNAFDEAMWEVLGNPDVPAFLMNAAILSPNGKYLGFSAERIVEDPSSWMGFSSTVVPYVFDLESGSYTVLDKGQEDVLASQVSDEGWVLGATPSGDFTRKAFLARGLDAEFEQLIGVIEEKDSELFSWMSDVMTHTVEDVEYVWNDELEDYDIIVTEREEVCEGTTYANKDFTTFAGWLMNNWDPYDECYFYSYLYGVNGSLTGVKDITATAASSFGVNAQLGGVLNLTGNIASITVYDINGRKVFTADAPAQQVSTGLANGTFIVSAKAADGKMITKKVVF